MIELTLINYVLPTLFNVHLPSLLSH